jgi:hydroxymethylbilane synthase
MSRRGCQAARREAGATLLALAGLKRLGLEHEAGVVLDPEAMVPAAGQGIVGVTVRADDVELRELLSPSRTPRRAPSPTAERALLARSTGPAARRSAAMRGCCRMARCG